MTETIATIIDAYTTDCSVIDAARYYRDHRLTASTAPELTDALCGLSEALTEETADGELVRGQASWSRIRSWEEAVERAYADLG